MNDADLRHSKVGPSVHERLCLVTPGDSYIQRILVSCCFCAFSSGLSAHDSTDEVPEKKEVGLSKA